MLNITLQFRCTEHGNGLWRANTALAKNSFFVGKLHSALNEFHDKIDSTPLEFLDTTQVLWDQIKVLTRKVANYCSRQKSAWRDRQLKRFQRKRNKILRHYPNNETVLNQRLSIVEKLIGDLQQEIVDIQALKTSIRWREHGEVPAGFLKRTATRRAVKRSIPTLIHPFT